MLRSLEATLPCVQRFSVGFFVGFSVVIAIVTFLGCASLWSSEKTWTRGMGEVALPVWTTDGMYLVSGRAGALFLTPDPLNLDQYRAVVLEDIQIRTRRRSRKLTPAEEERLKGYFTRRLEHVFVSNGWPIVEHSAADVLQVRLAVIDVELRAARRTHFGKIISGVSSDKISIALELRDPVEGNRRLLFGDKRRLPFGAYSGSDFVSLRRLEDAFYDFSIDMKRRLGEVQRGEFPPPPRPS